MSSMMAFFIILLLVSCSSEKAALPTSPSSEEPILAAEPDFLKMNIQKISSDAADGKLIGENIWSVDEHGITSFHMTTHEKRTYATEPGNYYNSIAYDKSQIWFYYNQLFGSSEVNNEVPLLRYDRKDGTLHRYTDDFLGIGSNLAVHSDGTTAWIVSENTAAVLDVQSNTIKSNKKLGSNARSIVGNDRFVWIGTLQDGVHELDKATGQITVYNEQSGFKNNFISNLLLSGQYLVVSWGGEGGDA
ncbi:hypothetical protein [Paenibacillus sp. MMS18-CY102]|uniref:hypothetical protein n=1 Tax=Paenibacillus sp. MMS18-CY102 TaxID=2682849 RepID=UPI0013657B7F|nr:hypothetical protein [Paenibacillus sp. MMS18-CY102]MWC27333.1 hypothetical protein [Paenibacillus sp. MMS18-CY102]